MIKKILLVSSITVLSGCKKKTDSTYDEGIRLPQEMTKNTEGSVEAVFTQERTGIRETGNS